MNAPVQFLFDECIGKPVMLEIARLTGTAAPFTHIVDYFGEGAKDREWVPALAAEGGWVVITSDGGRQSARREKLPLLCLEFGLTHVVLTPKLHSARSSAKAAALVALWPLIEEVAAAPQSVRYSLGIKTSRSVMTVAYKLWPVFDLPARPDRPADSSGPEPPAPADPDPPPGR